MGWEEAMETFGDLMEQNMWFSRVSLSAEKIPGLANGDKSYQRKRFGQQLSHLMGNSRRSRLVVNQTTKNPFTKRCADEEEQAGADDWFAC
ncbi:hypothetical protein PHYPSEUDO_011067 [Phytophthora pseudosyringae]|uniref:Uncharacterized protein n=1 Tax=Phytophthora pseudosyringae TaxID=221518 RepID=A0A8T1VBS8_9STRA|nr:hypothetical protein PHYPSEUDO_011067 [Phytophthora pseudosyringae]